MKCEACSGDGDVEFCTVCDEDADNCGCDEIASDMRPCDACNGEGEIDDDEDDDEDNEDDDEDNEDDDEDEDEIA